MSTTSLICVEDGSHDLVGLDGTFQTTSFNTFNPGITHTGSFLGIGLARFAYTGASTTFWLDSSTTVTPEFSLRLTVDGGNGYPFDLSIAAHISGTKTGFPTNGVSTLPATYWVDLVPTAPSTAPRGILLAKKRIAADPGVTLDVPLDMAGIIPAITDQSWNGSIYLVLWVTRASSSNCTFFYQDLQGLSGASGATLLLPATTLSVSNRDTGRQGPAGARGPYRRCPITGRAVLGERMVPDGYREGTLVHPDAYDPPEPEPRPDFGDRPSWAEENS